MKTNILDLYDYVYWLIQHFNDKYTHGDDVTQGLKRCLS